MGKECVFRIILTSLIFLFNCSTLTLIAKERRSSLEVTKTGRGFIEAFGRCKIMGIEGQKELLTRYTSFGFHLGIHRVSKREDNKTSNEIPLLLGFNFDGSIIRNNSFLRPYASFGLTWYNDLPQSEHILFTPGGGVELNFDNISIRLSIYARINRDQMGFINKKDFAYPGLSIGSKPPASS